MGKLNKNEQGFGAIEGIIIVAVVVLLGVVGYMVYKNHNKTTPTATTTTPVATTTPTTTPTPKAVDPYAGWKTYTSKTEKASFKYPSDWKSITPPLESNEPGADAFTVASPSGEVKVSWMSAISGLGGACDDTIAPKNGGCPAITVISSKSIKGASGLNVISAIVTNNGSTYQPWIGVNTSDFKNGQNTAYVTFFGRHNSSLPTANGEKQLMFFGTSGPSMSGPKLSQTDAKAWLSKSEVQKAKLIYESLTY